MLTRITNRVPVLYKSLLHRKLDATELLTQEHIRVESLLMQARLLSQVAMRFSGRAGEFRSRRKILIEAILGSLEGHMIREESVFYTECMKMAELAPKLSHSTEEHDQIRSLLAEISGIAEEEDASFTSALTQLGERISHHVNEEEETIFPLARELFSRTRLERMASQLKAVDRAKKIDKAA
jgi:hemerythrin-like domain-containing protein